MLSLGRAIIRSRLSKLMGLGLASFLLASINFPQDAKPFEQIATPTPPAVQPEQPDNTPPHFRAWLAQNRDQVPRFDALKAFLDAQGVGEVLPSWQLIQTETVDAATKCAVPGFAVPPAEMWPAIVPTLRLVRDQIVPLVGPVQVLSSFRTAEANKMFSRRHQFTTSFIQRLGLGRIVRWAATAHGYFDTTAPVVRLKSRSDRLAPARPVGRT
ncbi:MAG: hypothetical protein HC777_01880, partial [Hyphomonadaceae bacterium]|nr:hypothetical protein [Hyphomonadaceae bacterium]